MAKLKQYPTGVLDEAEATAIADNIREALILLRSFESLHISATVEPSDILLVREARKRLDTAVAIAIENVTV